MIQSVPMSVWGAGDGGFPIRLDANRTIWFYGDSFTVPLVGGYNFIHSAAHLLTNGSFHVCNGGNQIIPNDPDGVYYWPTGGVAVGPNRILVTSVAIRHFDDGHWEGVAFKAAYLNVTADGNLVFDRWLNYWPVYTPADLISWGTPVIDGENLVVFGWGSPEAPTNRRIVVATVKLSNVENASAWSIGTTPIRPEAESGASCSAWKDGNTWRVITTEPFFSPDVFMYSATNLAGPWERKVLVQVPKIFQTITYVPHWHPEIKLKNGKKLITLSRQSPGDYNKIYNNRLLCLEVDV